MPLLPSTFGTFLERRAGASVRDGAEAFTRSVLSWPPLADGPDNPSFPLSVRDAWADLHRMGAEPVPQPRPLVLVGGWLDPLVGMRWVERRLGRCFERSRVLLVHHAVFATHRAYRDRLVAAVKANFPGEEVDLVGHSMGGLVARYAAMPLEGGHCLAIRHLFTVGTCHRGAAMAPLVQAEPLARGMLPGSDHLAALDAALPARDYELTCYARLQDELVGTDRCAPVGHPLHWVPNRRFQRAHRRCRDDARILADIARRLRGEPPHAMLPASPLP